MTVRERIHERIDTLPDDRLTAVVEYLDEVEDGEFVSAQTEVAIREGMEDLRAGRAITLEDYRHSRGL